MNLNGENFEILQILKEIQLQLNTNPDVYCQTVLSLKKELDHTKQQLKETDLELAQVRKEYGEQLAMVNAECAKIHKQLTGIEKPALSNNQGQGSESLIEATSVRCILEELTAEVKQLKHQLYLIKCNKNCQQKLDSLENGVAGGPTLNDDGITEVLDLTASRFPTPKQLRSRTVEEENAFLIKELEDVKRKKFIKHGKSLMRTTVARISELINDSLSLVIEFSNILKFPLTNPKHYNKYNTTQLWKDIPTSIPGRTKEVICFQKESSWSFISGLISYSVGVNDLQLLINYLVLSEGTVKVAIAFAPTDLTIDETTFNALWELTPYSKIRPDQRQCDGCADGGELVVTCGTLRSRVSISRGTNAIMTVDVWLDEQPDRERGCGWTDDSLPDVLASIEEPFACAIAISNALDLDLEDPRIHMKNGNLNSLNLAKMESGTSQIVVASGSSVECIFSYRIKGADVRVVVTVLILHGRKSFAIAFIPLETLTDRNLLEELMEGAEWKTRPDRKIANAEDGEQLIEIRNIIVRARMVLPYACKAALHIKMSIY